MKRFLLLFFCCSVFFTVNSQTTVIIGNQGSQVSGTGPLVYGNYARFQTIYTAAELSAAGMVANSEITDIAFFITSSSNVPIKDYTIRMGHTTATNFSSPLSVPLTTVRNPADYTPIRNPSTATWDTSLNLNNHFIWNGYDNIGIDICSGLSISSYNNTVALYPYTKGCRSENAPCQYLPYDTYNYRPAIQLTFITTTCTTPTALSAGAITATSASASFTSVGTAFIVEYGAAGFTPGTDSTAGVGGTVVTGSASPIALTGLTGSTTYDVYVRQNCTNSGAGYSNNSIKATFTTLCMPGGDEVSYGNGSWEGYVYTWTGSPSFNSPNYKGNITENEQFDRDNGAGAIAGLTTNLCSPIPSDGYTVRYKMTKNFPAGYYKFTVGGDDGVRLSIDGGSTWLVNVWNVQSYTIYSSPTVFLNGSTNLVLEYYENAGDSRISFSYTIPCSTPTALSAGGVTNNSANIGFTSAGTAFIVEYGATGFTPGTDNTAGVGGTVVTGSASPIAITGLSGNTAYDVYVRQDCTGGGNGYSLNSSKATFTTLCSLQGDEVSYGNNSWKGYVYTWTGSPSFNTSDYIGYITENEQFDRDNANGAISGLTTNLCPPLPSDNFSIRYKMTKNFPAGYYKFTVGGDDGVRLSIDGGSTWLVNVWKDQSYTAYTSSLVYLNGSTNLVLEYYENSGGARSSFSYTIPCSTPTALNAGGVTNNSANISFTGAGTAFIVEYGAVGFTPGTDANPGVGGTIVTGGSSPISLTGLSGNTAYDVYVRQDCTGDANGYSLNSSKATFTTLCVPAGDEIAYGNGSWKGYVYTWTGSPSFNTPNYKGYITENEQFDRDNGAGAIAGLTTNLCPPIPSDSFTVRYKMTKNFPAGYYQFTVGGNDGVRLSIDGGNSWLVNDWIDQSYTTYTSPLVYLNGSTNLVLEYYENAGGARSSFSYTIPCSTPTALNAGGVTNNSANISFTGAGTAFIVEYGATGFTPGTDSTAGVGGTVVTGSGSPVAITGLSGNTAYDVYVRQDCTISGNGYSANSTKTTFTTLCGLISTYPFTEGFNAASLPACWSAYEGAQGASEHWQPVTADATHGAGTSAEGSHFLLMNYYDAVLSYNPYYLKSIPFDLGATAKKVKFDIWMGKNSGTDNLKFEISTNNGVSWTTLRTYSANPVNYSSNTPWDSKTIDLTAYTNQTVLFRLNATSNYGSGYCNIGFDNFIIEAIPACNEPVDLIANSITQNTASISFTGAGSAFIVEYGPVGFTPGTDSTAGVGGTLITGSASPIAISGLTGNTSYDVYVRQDCTGGGNGYSTNSSKATFTTLCGINSTYPYTEGFNTPGVIPACWSVYEGVQGSGVQWQSGALTGYSQYDIRYPAEGAGFMFFYAYYYNPNNAPYYLQSPIFNLGSSSKRARFALWMGAGVEADALKFQISTDSGSTWTSLASYSANPSHNSPNAPWDSKTVDLSAYTNQSVLFRLSVTSGTILNYRFIGFDNFIIEDKPLQAPQVVSVDSITKTTASVSFTEVGCTYIVEYGLAGFTPGTDSTAGVGGTIITTNSSPIAITGLTANTAYDVYVRRDCSATGKGFSINSNKVSFTTKCNTVTDFSENFDASLPQCWAQVGSNSVDISNNRLRMMSYNSKAVVRMPEVSNADAGTHRLKFSTKKSGGQTGNIQVGYLTNQDDPNTFVQLGNDYIPTKSSNSSDYDNFILSPVITPPGITTLAFRESTGNNGYIILIDNVKYETIPNCLEATDIVANTITNNTAIIHFTGTGSAFVVEYGATGFTPGTNNNAGVGGTIVTGGNSPIAITGLTANTTYDVYVRQNCTNSGNGYSANSIKATFTTLCDAANVPYILDIPFVDQYTLPNCTYNQTLFQGTGPDRDSRWLIETPPSGNALYYQYYEDSVNTWFYTNGINLTAGSNYIINYMYAKQGGAIQKLKIAYGILPNNTAMITQLADHSITANFGYSSNSVSFTPQVTGVYYFGFNLYTGSNTGGTSTKVRIKNISIDEVGQNKWTGTTDTDWNKGSNWSLGTMPTPSSNVVIPNTINKPVIGVNFPLIREAKNITIQTGSNLTITNESSLLVYGNIANNGTIIADSGTIAFVGTTLQTFNTGNTDIAIKGLGMDNAVGLTLSGTGKLNVTSELYTYRQGVFTTNNLLVLKSNENRTAILQSMFSLPTFVGNVTVERYIPAKASRKWSFLASPINQTLQDSWQQQIHITGAGTGGTVCPALTSHSNGFDATSTNAPSAYTYDASQTTGSRWQAVTNTNATNIGQGKAFRVNVRGSRSLGCDLLNGVNMVPNAVTLSSSGTLSTANKNFGTFSITYPNNGINNWVLIGNPYPANVSFSDLLSDLGNSNAIDSVYAVYIPSNNAGVYSYWSNVDGVFTGGTGYNNDNGNLIASGQAVFVKSKNVGNITLNFNEDLKYYTFSEEDLGYFRNNRRTINEKVKVSYGTIDKKIDEIVVRYDNNVTISNTALGKLDIPSMNYGTYITSLKGTTHTAVQTRSLSTLSTDEVWLNIGATQSGNYTFNFSDYENFTGADIYLVDHLAKITQDVKANPDYVFSVDVNNAATKGSNRFSIVFTKRIVEPSIVNNNIKMYPNPANKQVTLLLPQIADINYNIKVTDMAGKIILQQSRAGGYKQLNIEKLSTGTYIVEIIDSKGNRTTEKLIKN